MYLKIFFNFLFIAFIAIVQFSFVSALPGVLSGLNIMLVAIVFVLILFDENSAWWWTFGFAFLNDMMSFEMFGIFIISFSLSFFIINFLQKSFLTNRSLYTTLALTVFMGVFYRFFLYFLIYIISFFKKGEIPIIFSKEFLTEEVVSIFLNVFLALIVFIVVNFMSKRLKPAFLVRK